jgi:DNA-binding IscR family transcriptional regulator
LIGHLLSSNIGLKWSDLTAMLRLSKKTDYALLALQHLASEGASGFISALVIAARLDTPLEFLAKILQQSTRQRSIAAEKTVHGEHPLARRREAR